VYDPVRSSLLCMTVFCCCCVPVSYVVLFMSLTVSVCLLLSGLSCVRNEDDEMTTICFFFLHSYPCYHVVIVYQSCFRLAYANSSIVYTVETDFYVVVEQYSR
jgi:hypothetical protein